MEVGEASNPGPASKPRRTQRLRALQRSVDSDSEDGMPLVSVETVVDEPTPQDVLEALEHDLCQIDVEDQPIATRKDSEDDLLVEEPLRENGPSAQELFREDE